MADKAKWYEVLEASYIGDRLYQVGEQVQYDGDAGANLKAISAREVKAAQKEEALPTDADLRTREIDLDTREGEITDREVKVQTREEDLKKSEDGINERNEALNDREAELVKRENALSIVEKGAEKVILAGDRADTDKAVSVKK